MGSDSYMVLTRYIDMDRTYFMHGPGDVRTWPRLSSDIVLGHGSYMAHVLLRHGPGMVQTRFRHIYRHGHGSYMVQIRFMRHGLDMFHA